MPTNQVSDYVSTEEFITMNEERLEEIEKRLEILERKVSVHTDLHLGIQEFLTGLRESFADKPADHEVQE